MIRSALLALAVTAGLTGPAAVAEATPALRCRGAGIDPAAQLHHRTETFVEAPAAAVWKLHTDVARWPAWQSAVTSAKKLDAGPLRPGSRFRWTTPAPPTPTTPATTLVITSTVGQVQPGRCVRWTGPAIGDGLRIDRGVHVWTFTPVRGGVLVRTEESWTGAQIEADPATALRYLAPGLDAWLADLKTTAEAHGKGTR
ncbi:MULTISPECIES: SRPBCC family protein [unclassified Amycolatopsis]|uniref:SRPBCC family protein n=1 Tax=unclassified Amycolatopsis TaxID=2618356 RepID=UPI00287503A4|nr:MULTISPECIES: SRPBCC family protein [unclassified Amycolatopsis]MDS0138776.1 SRPBCC family protein [Amycolatopsis sp. 505]MDS0147270.1 SRPBCC family protein [Amycolatopsis sp. CM201R]